ncbi:MAG: IgGFc-binding protein [Labilithrix sp.]|nr:IgGFc-binding protein [Labilithrix sp.]
MKRASLLTGSVLAVAIAVAACSKSRGGFVSAQETFVVDAGEPPVEQACPLQCAPDLRSVVRSCDGTIAEVCPPNLACGGGGCIDPCAAAAEAQGSVGCEFVMVPPATTLHSSRSCYAAYVVNAQPVGADLRIEYRGQTMDLAGSVFEFAAGTGELRPHEGALQSGEGVVIFLADPPNKKGAEREIFCPEGVKALTTEWPNPIEVGIGEGATFRLVSSVPVTASTIYPFGGARSFMPSATLLLPVAGWGKQHVLVGAWERAAGPSRDDYPGLQIVAAEDDTEIDVLTGSLRHRLRTHKLSRGQSLQLMLPEDPSGSIIASNKPTSVFGGHSCLNIPSNVCCCDAEQQQLPALEQWGSKYAVVGHRSRTGSDPESSPVRIVAAIDGTQLSYDPAPPAGAPRTMESGEIVTFWTNAPLVVKTQDADHPIYVAQYMTGHGVVKGLGGGGDPEFVNVVPAGQYLGSYAFYADPTYKETALVIVRQKQGGEYKDVWLACAKGNVPDFTPLGADGEFEYARVDLTRNGLPVSVLPDGPPCGHGFQRLRSDGPFTATLWGWDSAASYAYPGGMGQRRLVTKLPRVH